MSPLYIIDIGELFWDIKMTLKQNMEAHMNNVKSPELIAFGDAPNGNIHHTCILSRIRLYIEEECTTNRF